MGTTQTDPVFVHRLTTRVARASAHIESANTAYSAALSELEGAGISHPIIDQLRAAVLDGKKLLARSADLVRRLPK